MRAEGPTGLFWTESRCALKVPLAYFEQSPDARW